MRRVKITDGGDSGDDFSKLELVQDGCLTSSIETYHQNPHFLLRKQPAEQLRERQPHLLSLLNRWSIADPSQFHSNHTPKLIIIIKKFKWKKIKTGTERDRIRKGLFNRRGIEFAYLFSFVRTWGFHFSKRRANRGFFYFYFFVLGERVRERSQLHFAPLFNDKNVFDTASHCAFSKTSSFSFSHFFNN